MPPSDVGRTADVVVIGAGIVGAACARALSRAGRHVVVLDRGPAVSATTASGEGNILVSDKAPGPELELARLARGLWDRLVEEVADELGPTFPSMEFESKGGLVVATTAKSAAPLCEFAGTQRAAGVQANEVTLSEALRLEPWLSPAVTSAVHYPEDAQVQPVVAAEAMLESARRSGAKVLTHAAVRAAIIVGSRIVGVETANGDIHAGVVLNASGPWAHQVSSALGAPIDVRPRRGVVLVTTRMPQRIFHKVYDADYVGATQSAAANLQTSSVVESTRAGTVLIGSSREQVGFDRRLRVEVLRELAIKAQRLFPFLSEAAVMRTYGGFRPYVPDHVPVIGEDPRLPGLWHATGHEGAGVGLSVATAQLILALVGGEAPPIDPAPFRVDRAAVLGVD